LWKAEDRHKERKEEQKDKKAGGHCGGGNKSFTGGTNGRKNECLRDRV